MALPQYEQEDNVKSHQSLQKQQQPLVSSLAKSRASAIKIQIQGSQSNLNGHTNYRRHISFDDSCKKDDGDEVRKNHIQKQTNQKLAKKKYEKKVNTKNAVSFILFLSYLSNLNKNVMHTCDKKNKKKLSLIFSLQINLSTK